MVSGHQDAATINEAYARGVADFVLKPVNPALEITAQRLVYKSGGKHGEWIHPDGMPPEVEKILADWG